MRESYAGKFENGAGQESGLIVRAKVEKVAIGQRNQASLSRKSEGKWEEISGMKARKTRAKVKASRQ